MLKDVQRRLAELKTCKLAGELVEVETTKAEWLQVMVAP
jgi:hypothetical protein